MGWFCPTFQRPDRLQALAKSWMEKEFRTPLTVRLWAGDPKLQEYMRMQWPSSWEFYVSAAEWCGEALNDYLIRYPNEKFYGFIGDDIELGTHEGLAVLERAAGEWNLAYPDDGIQGEGLATHFCVGGEFIRALTYWALPSLRHHYIDNVLHNVAANCGVLRWCPGVKFIHRHPYAKGAEMDDTYRKADTIVGEGSKNFEEWAKGGQFVSDVKRLRSCITANCKEAPCNGTVYH